MGKTSTSRRVGMLGGQKRVETKMKANCSHASGLTRHVHRRRGWPNPHAGTSSHRAPLQHLSWEAIQPHLEIWIWKILETVSPPASSSCSPAPSPRATASSDSRLVSSCFLRMVRTSPPQHRPQDPPPPLHPLQTGLTNQATQKRLALPRGREKCQKSNAPGRSSNATSTQRPASKDTPTAWPAMITTTKFVLM